MFSLITIRHTGRHALPRYFHLKYRDMSLNIRITRGCSLISLQPTLNSGSIKGVPIFQKTELSIPSDEIPVDFSTYVEHLRIFLDTFLVSERAQARTQMDMLRYLFMINDMESARVLMEKMPLCGDVRMLKFIADRTDSSHVSASRHQVRLGWETPAEQPEPADDATARQILRICSEVNEKTRCIFILEVLVLLPPEKLPTIMGGLGITDTYTKTYLSMKICERLVSLRLERMAAHMLASTALELKGGQDLKLREELVRMALSYIPCGRWRRRALQLIDNTVPSEVKQASRGRMSILSAATNCGRKISLVIRSQNPIFSFTLFKKWQEDWCTGSLCVHNRGRIPIDGIFTKSTKFIPIFSAAPISKVDISDEYLQDELGEVHLDYFLLADGRRVSIDRRFKLVEGKGTLVPKEIECDGGRYIWTFEICRNAGTIALGSEYGAVQRADSRLKVYLNPGMRALTMEVEISKGLYEEQTYRI